MVMLIVLHCLNNEFLAYIHWISFSCMNLFFLIIMKKSHLSTLVGKSTTTSMLAYVLKAMGDDLTAVIGAQVPQVQ